MSKKSIPDSGTILGHFDDPTNFDRFRRYGESKLLVSASVRRLAAISPSEVIVNNLCPGLVQTGLDKNLPFPLKSIMELVRKFTARTVEEGARTLIYASAIATSETNGKFLQNNEISM